MKYLLILIFALVSLSAFSQDFNGDYISLETSFINNNDDESFTEETLFNIAVIVNLNEGYVAIQDPRIPSKILSYRITEEKTQVQNLTFYSNSIAEHSPYKEKVELIFYTDDDGNLNLMINTKNTSQVFKDLDKK